MSLSKQWINGIASSIQKLLAVDYICNKVMNWPQIMWKADQSDILDYRMVKNNMLR